MAALSNHQYVHFALALATAGLTAFYMSRLYFVVFYGSSKSKGASHAHEADFLMLAPLVLLAGISIDAAFCPLES